MINKRFEIVKEIGKGRSKVFLCKDYDFGHREVAVKFLPPNVDESEFSLFRDEFFILQRLEHPGIIRSYEIGTAVRIDQSDPIEIGSPFITLEYFKSVELSRYELLSDESKLKEILKQLCSVLYYLHQSNYIYYDLKPENILVSDDSGSLQIKLIDLGLAEFLPDKKKHTIKGTAQYIAPELLKQEPHDHRVDLYSLGILLYEIIYKRLPFDTDDELKIYKAQVEQDFDFPLVRGISNELIEIVKKLLQKAPSERYSNTLEVITDLGFEISPQMCQNFMPARVSSGRDDLINILSLYIQDKNSSEVFTIRGFDGAGRSSLINRIYEKFSNSVLVSNTQGISGIDLIKLIVKKIAYSKQVYLNLDEREKEQIVSFIEKNQKNFIGELHSVLSVITGKSKFILLIDDYNLFDPFTGDMIKEIVPALQVNNIKVIVSESSDFDYTSKDINNLREISIGSFVEKQLTEFLNIAFYDLFPWDQLKELILSYADLLPGNIIDFIRDMINLNVIIFDPVAVRIEKNVEKLSSIEGSLTAIYDMRLANLNEKELNLAKVISVFEGNPDQMVLKGLLNLNQEELNDILSTLQINNIIQSISGANTIPVISSDGLKKHIYSLIENKKEFHSQLAETISGSGIEINRSEFARQYELASDFEAAYFIWKEELRNAEGIAAFSYMKSILNHLLELKISESEKNEVRYQLIEILYHLSDFITVLNNIEKVDVEGLTSEKALELYIIQGSSLINSGKLEEGMKLINSLIPKVKDEFRRSKLFVELAYAKFDANNFSEAAKLGEEILSRKDVSDEDRGRVHNLLGLCAIYIDQNSDESRDEFFKALEYYKQADLKDKVAAIEVNIGNVYNLQGDSKNAELHWKNALNLNLSIGSLEQEAVLLLNNGIYYADKANFEESKVSYLRAHKIFLSLGNTKNQGITLTNLGEVYFTTCEYQNALNALRGSKTIFEQTQNVEELVAVNVLLGFLYFTIGSHNKLNEIYEETSDLLKKHNAEKKYNCESALLKNINSLLSGQSIVMEEFIEVRTYYLEKEEFKIYVTVSTILLNYLINSGLFLQAEEELENPVFIKVCDNNNFYKGIREYFWGRLSLLSNSGNSSKSIEYFERAYNYLIDQSIGELTWKVLLSLAEVYTIRGLHNKAKNFIIYARDLINLIAENIESTQLKSAYLQQEERRTALENLEIFQKK